MVAAAARGRRRRAIITAAPISAASLIGLLPLLSMFVAHQAQGRSAFVFLRDLPAVVAKEMSTGTLIAVAMAVAALVVANR